MSDVSHYSRDLLLSVVKHHIQKKIVTKATSLNVKTCEGLVFKFKFKEKKNTPINVDWVEN